MHNPMHNPMHKPMHNPMPMHKFKLQMYFLLLLIFLLLLLLNLLLLLLLNNQDNNNPDNQDNQDNQDNHNNHNNQSIHPNCRPTEEKEEARRAKKVFVVARTSPRPEENTPPSADPANNGLIIFEIFSNIPKIEFPNETN